MDGNRTKPEFTRERAMIAFELFETNKFYKLTSDGWNHVLYFFILEILEIYPSRIKLKIVNKYSPMGISEVNKAVINLPINPRDHYEEISAREFLLVGLDAETGRRERNENN